MPCYHRLLQFGAFPGLLSSVRKVFGEGEIAQFSKYCCRRSDYSDCLQQRLRRLRTDVRRRLGQSQLWAVRVDQQQGRKVCIRCKCEVAVRRWGQLTFNQPRNWCLCCGAEGGFEPFKRTSSSTISQPQQNQPRETGPNLPFTQALEPAAQFFKADIGQRAQHFTCCRFAFRTLLVSSRRSERHMRS